MKSKLWGPIVWLTITFFVVYGFFLNTAGAVFGDTVKAFFKASDIGAAAAVGSFVVGFAVMQIPAGYLLDRFNSRWVVGAGLFLLALGNLTLSLSPNLTLFCLSNFLQGLGASFAFIAAGKLVSQWFTPNLFPVMFGLTQSISCILAAVIHYYLVLALETMTWQSIYTKLSLFGFALFAISLAVIHSPKQTREKQPLSLKESLAKVLANGQIWLCAVCAAFSFGVLTAYGSFWYLDIQKFYSVNTPDSLIISGLVFVGIGIGTPFLGWVSNVIQSRKLVIHVSLVLATMFLMMGVYLPHFDLDTYLIIDTVSFLIGFFLSGSMLFYTCTSELASNETRGVALGFVNTLVFSFNTLLLFVPQLFITDFSKTFFTYLWILPSSILMAILLIYFVKETYIPNQLEESA